jgi:hypothetical protein
MAEDNIKESTVFRVGDDIVDAWGNAAEESENDDDGVNYNKMSAKDLVAEVNRRNEGREEDDQILFDGKPKKGEVVQALEDDDKAQAEADDEEE